MQPMQTSEGFHTLIKSDFISVVRAVVNTNAIRAGHATKKSNKVKLMHHQPNNTSRNIYKYYFSVSKIYWQLGWHKTVLNANKQD